MLTPETLDADATFNPADDGPMGPPAPRVRFVPRADGSLAQLSPRPHHRYGYYGASFRLDRERDRIKTLFLRAELDALFYARQMRRALDALDRRKLEGYDRWSTARRRAAQATRGYRRRLMQAYDMMDALRESARPIGLELTSMYAPSPLEQYRRRAQ